MLSLWIGEGKLRKCKINPIARFGSLCDCVLSATRGPLRSWTPPLSPVRSPRSARSVSRSVITACGAPLLLALAFAARSRYVGPGSYRTVPNERLQYIRSVRHFTRPRLTDPRALRARRAASSNPVQDSTHKDCARFPHPKQRRSTWTEHKSLMSLHNVWASRLQDKRQSAQLPSTANRGKRGGVVEQPNAPPNNRMVKLTVREHRRGRHRRFGPATPSAHYGLVSSQHGPENARQTGAHDFAPHLRV